MVKQRTEAICTMWTRKDTMQMFELFVRVKCSYPSVLTGLSMARSKVLPYQGVALERKEKKK